jgi:hypothetical protein
MTRTDWAVAIGSFVVFMALGLAVASLMTS